MKKFSHLTKTTTVFTLIALLAIGCGKKDDGSLEALIKNDDLKAIRAKKKELSDTQKQLASDIAMLDSAIAAKVGNVNLPLVTVLQTRAQVFDHFVELQGEVTTKQNVLIYPEVSGTLQEVKVKKGSKVQKGQELANVDDGGMKSQLSQLETQLQLAKTTYERQKSLWEKNIGSEIQYLQMKANYEAQEKAVRQLEKQVAKYTITAPFSGIIDEVIKDQGTVVAPTGPGSEIFRIVNLSNMYLDVFVPESYLTSVVPGKSVKVYFPVLNDTVDTKVRQTGNFINPNNRSFTAEIPVPSMGGVVKPNLTAKVHINDYTSDNAVLLPLSVLSENAEGQQYVFVAEKLKKDKTATAAKRIVTTGMTQGSEIEITSGINSGEYIIVEGARSVKEGQTIKILSE